MNKIIIKLEYPWGKSPEDLFIQGNEYEAQQLWRKEQEIEFRKNMVKLLSPYRRK